MDTEKLGARIKEARVKKGMTQEELAEKLGLSVQHISVLERGVKVPKLENFVNIANLLEVDANTLLKESLLYVSDVNVLIRDGALDQLTEKQKSKIKGLVEYMVKAEIE